MLHGRKLTGLSLTERLSSVRTMTDPWPAAGDPLLSDFRQLTIRCVN
jgi:hypothetical protein